MWGSLIVESLPSVHDLQLCIKSAKWIKVVISTTEVQGHPRLSVSLRLSWAISKEGEFPFGLRISLESPGGLVVPVWQGLWCTCSYAVFAISGSGLRRPL